LKFPVIFTDAANLAGNFRRPATRFFAQCHRRCMIGNFVDGLWICPASTPSSCTSRVSVRY
ncbi:hypothetical protein ALC56_01395, partial [Trachymyrmex septentrionalis]